jgi:hypothetical protein
MDKSPESAYEEALRNNIIKSICVADLVNVIAFHPEDMTVDVKPIMRDKRNGQSVSRPPLLKVPVAMIGGAGLIIRPWYGKGDTGVVIYLDSGSDKALLEGKEDDPSTSNRHTGQEAVFCGIIAAGSNLYTNMPKEGIVIGNSETYIAVTNGQITLHGKVVEENG